ncbi:MAG: prepilin peptidase, partial [Firmicutes bacterium]|nr:prepilin peptidase [Bacillota bacterium]
GWNLTFWSSVLGALVGFSVMFIIVLISRGGMGMGDAKLMAMIGAFLGWKNVFFVLFWASVLGSIGGILFLYFTKQDRKTPIPFGPFLAASALLFFLIA